MIEYRRAELNDMDELLRVRINFLYDAKNISAHDEEAAIRKANEEFLKEVLIDGSFMQWLAVEEGKIVATSSVSFYRLPPNRGLPTGKAAYIGNMYTYPEYRKKGIASKLLSLAVEEAKNYGCNKVLLNATDMGRPIYEKFGFTDSKDDMVYWIL